MWKLIYHAILRLVNSVGKSLKLKTVSQVIFPVLIVTEIKWSFLFPLYENILWQLFSELDRLIAAAMTRDQVSKEWHCNYCTKSHKDKARITRHVEVHFPGYTQHCMFCGKELISRNALRNHISDVHTKQQNKHRMQS